MTLQDYLIDQTGLDWPSLLEEWRWLLPPSFRVWFLTRAGDLVITVPEGSIHFLDVGAGELRQVAHDREEFCCEIDNPGRADDWLMIPVVDELVASGVMLNAGQCYSYRTLPTLGGSYKADNRVPFPIREHFGAWGSVQRQIADLPNGSNVVIKPVE
jgi:Domain of unknown function (DUF1851)